MRPGTRWRNNIPHVGFWAPDAAGSPERLEAVMALGFGSRLDGNSRPARGLLRGRHLALAASVGAVAVLFIASAGFACTYHCCTASLVETSGRAGSQVTVKGVDYQGQTATIRWAASDGPVLATVTGDDWEQKVTIPDAGPGFYSIFVQARYLLNNEPTEMAPTFRVTGSATTSATTTPTATSTGPVLAPTPAEQVSPPLTRAFQ